MEKYTLVRWKVKEAIKKHKTTYIINGIRANQQQQLLVRRQEMRTVLDNKLCHEKSLNGDGEAASTSGCLGSQRCWQSCKEGAQQGCSGVSVISNGGLLSCFGLCWTVNETCLPPPRCVYFFKIWKTKLGNLTLQTKMRKKRKKKKLLFLVCHQSFLKVFPALSSLRDAGRRSCRALWKDPHPAVLFGQSYSTIISQMWDVQLLLRMSPPRGASLLGHWSLQSWCWIILGRSIRGTN